MAAATINEDSYPLTFLLGYARANVTDGTYETAKVCIDVPDAARLKLIKIIGYTDSTYGEIIAQCIRKDNNNNILTLAAIANGGTSSGQASFDATVDHVQYSYYFQLMAKVDAGGSVTDAKIYKLYLEYTTTNLGMR